jgi:hypothetical protein
MGKHMGQHPHTRYISPKLKNPQKGAEIPRSLLQLALYLR